MGDDVLVYCEAHREELDFGSWPPPIWVAGPGAVRRNAEFPNLTRREGIRLGGPTGKPLVDRVVLILEAFVGRHHDCLLRVVSEYSGGRTYKAYERVAYAGAEEDALSPVNWVAFNVSEDGVSRRLEALPYGMTADEHRAWLEQGKDLCKVIVDHPFPESHPLARQTGRPKRWPSIRPR